MRMTVHIVSVATIMLGPLLACTSFDGDRPDQEIVSAARQGQKPMTTGACWRTFTCE